MNDRATCDVVRDHALQELFRVRALDANVGARPLRGARRNSCTWDFRIFGSVESEIALSYDELQALPQTEITTDIHCVTRWSRFDASFRGVHWRELAKLVTPMPEAHFVVAHAEQGFTSNVPLEALEDEQALIAWEADGEPLTPDHGWPLRLVVPSRYFWKSAKWLRGLEIRPNDRPGFWERYGYHNDADYWKEQRYGF